MQFLEREHDFLLLLLLPARWNANQMTGTPGAVLDHEVTLGMEATCGRAKRWKKPGSLAPQGFLPTLDCLAVDFLNIKKK